MGNISIEVTAENRNVIIKKLRTLRNINNQMVIGVDGICSSGKTNLAHYIASELCIDSIHLDHFLVHKLDCYLKALNSGLLMQQLKIMEGKSFIIEGCCLLDVAKFLNLGIDVLIYCKEVSRDTNIWHYGTNFDEYAPSDIDSNFSGLDKELFEYHKKMQPWMGADFTYILYNDLKMIQKPEEH